MLPIRSFQRVARVEFERDCSRAALGSSFELELELSLSNSAHSADRQLCCRLELSKTNGRPSSYASYKFYKFLTAVERDYRKSRKGRPLGPLSNSNCLFRTRTVQNKLPRAAPRRLSTLFSLSSFEFELSSFELELSRTTGRFGAKRRLATKMQNLVARFLRNPLRPSSGFHTVWKKALSYNPARRP